MKTALALAASTLTFTAGLSCAPTACADEDSYIWNLENSQSTWFHGNRLQLIVLGYAVCADLAAGNTIATETSVVLANPNFDFNVPAARELVLHAEENLC